MPELLEKILKTEARENGEQSKASGPVQVMVHDLVIPVPQFGVANSNPKFSQLKE